MKEIGIDELKKLQVEMLVLIDEFCQHNNIRYSLSSGTLIGAVRHKGYIPWDDDIDIMMPREDYDRFVSTFNGAYGHLSLLAPEINCNYYAPYANVFDNRTLLLEGDNSHRGIEIGVKIDIFPIDTVPDDLDAYKKEMYTAHRINAIMYDKRNKCPFEFTKERIKLYIKKAIYAFIPYSFLQKKIRLLAVGTGGTAASYVDFVVYNIYYKKLPRFSRSVMDSYIRVPFEGKEFSIVSNYDEVLKAMYGDYMQLPPLEKRVTHHNFSVYWK